METSQIIALLVAIMAACDGLALYANRVIVQRSLAAHRDQYRSQLEEAARRCNEAAVEMKEYQAIERQIMDLKADLPVSYVRKEDFMRYELVINTKIDRIHDKQERMYELLTEIKKGGE